MRLGYVAGFDKPVVVLEDKIIAALIDEAAGDALMNFLVAASLLDPANLSKAEP